MALRQFFWGVVGSKGQLFMEIIPIPSLIQIFTLITFPGMFLGTKVYNCERYIHKSLLQRIYILMMQDRQ